MKPEDFPEEIRNYLIPQPGGMLRYRCVACAKECDIGELHYICPECGQILLIEDLEFDRLQQIPAQTWQRIFDYRKMLSIPALKGIYRYYEFVGPVIPLSAIIYLGEGHTPLVEANAYLQQKVGLHFYFKNDGQNPSASFKDRGMASALSYINFLLESGKLPEVLAVCASTGDTSAAAALYASYLHPRVKSAVILPHKKVTPQQLYQPLASGATVFEVPGVFDDCMKVVEDLAQNYPVALLNSKNAWRVLGQESYAFEIAQDLDYNMQNTVVLVPIGNAGNISAVLSGFLKFFLTGIIQSLPKIIGIQSLHADPVYRYYSEPDPARRRFVPLTVKSSVAQAAMIGNPVSMPRVIHLVERYNQLAGSQKIFFVAVAEQAIMDWGLLANRNGHIACTHGGECLAGLLEAKRLGFVHAHETAILDSTAHPLKFSGFTQMYFENRFPAEFGINPDPGLINAPSLIKPQDLDHLPAPGKPLCGNAFEAFVKSVSLEIAGRLNLKKV